MLIVDHHLLPPLSRPVIIELQKAFAVKDLILGASSHRIEHWFFLSHGREFDSDIKEPLERGDLYWHASGSNFSALKSGTKSL